MEQLNATMNSLAVNDVKDGRKPGDYIPASEGETFLSDIEVQTLLTYLANGTIFEVRPSPGKRHGVFALQDIPRGSCIFTEKAVITLPPHLAQVSGLRRGHHLHEEFKKLSAAELASYSALTPNAQYASTFHPIAAMELRRWLVAEGYTGSALDEAVATEIILVAIFANNSVGLGDSSGGVFLTYSHMNHSCVPNVQHKYNPKLGEGTVFAIRDIEEGEEILTTYVHLLLPRQERAERLKYWDIQCDCEACSDVSGASERRRKHLFEFDTARQNGEYLMIGKRTVAPSLRVACAREVIRYMEEEGIVNMLLAGLYVIIVMTCLIVCWAGANIVQLL